MAKQGTSARMIEVAKKEVGTVEGPKDNETKYGKAMKANFLPWCGSFLNDCANVAGVKAPNTVSTVSGSDAFKKMGTWSDSAVASPQPGDFAYIDFPGDNVDRISHVALVVKDNKDGTVDTIEGNTSSSKKGDQRNGGEVCEKVRGYKSNKSKVFVSIVGFGRPNYKDNDITAKVIPAIAPTFPGQIKPGDKGDGVKVVQRALGLAIDGVYGPMSKKSVMDFQANHGKLDANGIIGPKTWVELVKLL